MQKLRGGRKMLLSLLVFTIFQFSWGDNIQGNSNIQKGEPLPLVLPTEGGTGFVLQEDSIKHFAKFNTPVALVTVIGPYRSGKSFLLNQLLSLPCSNGFGVGHQRSAHTKGVWFWSEPVIRTINGQKTSIFFLDTEGLQSMDRTEGYDDRLFALASLISSLLVYNLPETVKSQDLEKLSFSVTLADEFFDRANTNKAENSEKEEKTNKNEKKEEQGEAPDMPSLVWLIQRDFLQSDVSDAVRDVLVSVPNPKNDPHIEKLNRIRESLRVFKTQRTFGLVQPHNDRTKLCDMTDADFDPRYVSQRDQLREALFSLSSPKLVNSSPLTGESLGGFFRQIVAALNAAEVPAALNIVEIFNGRYKEESYAKYKTEMKKVALPVAEETLERAHYAAADVARRFFASKRFGRSDSLAIDVLENLLKERKTANELASLTQCDKYYTICVESIETSATAILLSLGRVEAKYDACRTEFAKYCVGPSNTTFSARLEKHWERRYASIEADFNEKLSANLSLIAFAVFLLARFWFTKPLLELIAALLFVVLAMGPRMMGDSFYRHDYWTRSVQLYEAAVFNHFIDLERYILYMPGLLALAVAFSFLRKIQKGIQARRRGRVDREMLPV